MLHGMLRGMQRFYKRQTPYRINGKRIGAKDQRVEQRSPWTKARGEGGSADDRSVLILIKGEKPPAS